MHSRWRRYLSREELYELVWSEPALKLGPRLGVSDVAIAKLCKRLNVPKPYLGYWAQLAHGKSPARTALPSGEGWPSKGSLPNRDVQPVEDTSAACTQAKVEKDNPIEVESVLSEPDPVLAPVLDVLASARVKSDGYLWSQRKGFPEFYLTPTTQEKAILILNSLLKALQLRGFEVCVQKQVEVVTSWGPISFVIEEYTREVEREPTAAEARRDESIRQWHRDHKPPRYTKDVLTGNLALRITTENLTPDRRIWRGSEKRPLERQLNSFIVGLVRFAENRDLELKRRERERIRREQDDRERERIWELRRREEARQQKLWKLIDTWESSKQVRRFAHAIEVAETQRGPIDEPTRRYLSWMKGVADAIDPTAGSDPKVREEICKFAKEDSES